MASETQDVDENQTPAVPAPKFQPFQRRPFAPLKPVFVAPPASPGDIVKLWNAENSDKTHITRFLTRWPPSRTSSEYGLWITCSRGGWRRTATPNIAGLEADFQALIAADNVSVETVNQISKSNFVVCGKWMIFEESGKIDILWGKILSYLCTERQKGSAKVSIWKEGEEHVICVYAEDYTDTEEVSELRRGLRSLGVNWKIGFKTDAYTYLNIYTNNPWKLRPSIFLE